VLDGFPIVRLAEPRTVRLVSTARLRPPVLAQLVPNDELDALFEIEAATSGRLVGQNRGTQALDPNEFVYGIPHANFINASFAYARPRGLNRFNGPGRGAWYAALAVETALAEVIFHMTRELADVGDFHAVVEYAEMHASFAGEFLDLRELEQAPPCLDPDPAISYPHGNAVADAARARGLNGIIYLSARHPGGVCLTALSPHAVQSVAQGEVWRITWNGSPTPTVELVKEG
jgi:hypothetical protein